MKVVPISKGAPLLIGPYNERISALICGQMFNTNPRFAAPLPSWIHLYCVLREPLFAIKLSRQSGYQKVDRPSPLFKIHTNRRSTSGLVIPKWQCIDDRNQAFQLHPLFSGEVDLAMPTSISKKTTAGIPMDFGGLSSMREDTFPMPLKK